jgi:predicted GIY-YIG superfamily endonuclease
MNPEKDKFETVREKIKTFPMGPGLYFMKGHADKVLYIGKAKNLRARVASYFQPSSDLASSRGPKIVEMVNKVEAIDFLETESEVDAMLQEARLIKPFHISKSQPPMISPESISPENQDRRATDCSAPLLAQKTCEPLWRNCRKYLNSAPVVLKSTQQTKTFGSFAPAFFTA